MIAERKAGGPYRDFHDFLLRSDARAINKRVLENLIASGAFDFSGAAREELFAQVDSALSALGELQRKYPALRRELPGAPPKPAEEAETIAPRPRAPAASGRAGAPSAGGARGGVRRPPPPHAPPRRGRAGERARGRPRGPRPRLGPPRQAGGRERENERARGRAQADRGQPPAVREGAPRLLRFRPSAQRLRRAGRGPRHLPGPGAPAPAGPHRVPALRHPRGNREETVEEGQPPLGGLQPGHPPLHRGPEPLRRRFCRLWAEPGGERAGRGARQHHRRLRRRAAEREGMLSPGGRGPGARRQGDLAPAAGAPRGAGLPAADARVDQPAVRARPGSISRSVFDEPRRQWPRPTPRPQTGASPRPRFPGTPGPHPAVAGVHVEPSSSELLNKPDRRWGRK